MQELAMKEINKDNHIVRKLTIINNIKLLNLNSILFVENNYKKHIKYYNKSCSLKLKLLYNGLIKFSLHIRDELYWDGVEGVVSQTYDGTFYNIKYNKDVLRIPSFTVKFTKDILYIIDPELNIKLKDNGYQ